MVALVVAMGVVCGGLVDASAAARAPAEKATDAPGGVTCTECLGQKHEPGQLGWCPQGPMEGYCARPDGVAGCVYMCGVGCIGNVTDCPKNTPSVAEVAEAIRASEPLHKRNASCLKCLAGGSSDARWCASAPYAGFCTTPYGVAGCTYLGCDCIANSNNCPLDTDDS